MQKTAKSRLKSPLVVLAVAVVMAVAAPVMMWCQYGPTVFFETIRIGFVACFG